MYVLVVDTDDDIAIVDLEKHAYQWQVIENNDDPSTHWYSSAYSKKEALHFKVVGYGEYEELRNLISINLMLNIRPSFKDREVYRLYADDGVKDSINLTNKALRAIDELNQEGK